MAISFLISMYPAYIVQVNVAWCECFLIFVLVVDVFISRLKWKIKSFQLISIGILSVYQFMIHQRALGIMIACFGYYSNEAF